MTGQLFASVMLLSACSTLSADEPLEGAIIVNFSPLEPSPRDSWRIQVHADVAGASQKAWKGYSIVTGGITAEGLCKSLSPAIPRDDGWVVAVVGPRLYVQGWKDPKTGKFYPVKSVTFTSDNIPPDRMPRVTDARRKA